MPADRRPEGPPSAGGYLPIGEHGVIGDLDTVALVGAEGTIDWYCPGRIDAPSVFGALRDARRGGHWSLCPAGGHWRSRQRYLPDTNVLVTRFLSEDGELELEDFMPVGAAAGTLVRRINGVRGDPHIVMEVEPRFDYARRLHTLRLDESGALFESDGQALSLRAPLRLRRTRTGVQSKFAVAAGEVITLTLSAGEPAEADAFDTTVAFWRSWLAAWSYHGRWREPVRRSALVLRLLAHARCAPGGHSHAAFNAAEELARAGRLDEASREFERTLGYANGLGLFSEALGPGGEQLGDFPHAATHLALISAALTLDALLSAGGPSGKT
jgi:GH15 family glucan-1,4-alpha-glucosidase